MRKPCSSRSSVAEKKARELPWEWNSAMMCFQVLRLAALWAIVLLGLFGLGCSSPLEGGPENVHFVTLEGHKVRITWDPVRDAEFYKIDHLSEIPPTGNFFRDAFRGLDGTPMKRVSVKEKITRTTWEGHVGELLNPRYSVRACDRNECGPANLARQVAVVTKGPCIGGMVLTPGDACLVDTEGDKEFLVDHSKACLRVTTESWEPPTRFPTRCGKVGILIIGPGLAAKHADAHLSRWTIFLDLRPPK